MPMVYQVNFDVDGYRSLSGLHEVKIMEDFGLHRSPKIQAHIFEVHIGESER